MSKRFGRNQKRKLLQQTVLLNEQVKKLEQDLYMSKLYHPTRDVLPEQWKTWKLSVSASRFYGVPNHDCRVVPLQRIDMDEYDGVLRLACAGSTYAWYIDLDVLRHAPNVVENEVCLKMAKELFGVLKEKYR